MYNIKKVPTLGGAWQLSTNEEAWALAIEGYSPIDKHNQE
jgi:hypothetical protein